MSRQVLIVTALVIVATAAFATTFYFVQASTPASSKMSEKQRATRDKFFGTAREQLPIERGQEMRPRW